jgi:hypothetical protein
MRDEMDGRIWTAHHDQFSVSIDNGLGAIGGAIRLGLSSLPKLPAQLMSGVAAFSITLLTLGAMAA